MSSNASIRGATLIVTLGILVVLSVIIVGFFATSRLQRQTSASNQHRFNARNQIDQGIHLAMQFVEQSLTYPYYYSTQDAPEGFLTYQRLAPVGGWFGESYTLAAELDQTIAFQAPDVLASPTMRDQPHVNLLTPQVARLLPSILTNALPILEKDTNGKLFRSGWMDTDLAPTNATTEEQLLINPTRIAFTVLNCSSLMDANYFETGPTNAKISRICFNQADVTNWIAAAEKTNLFERLKLAGVDPLATPADSPFFHLSYDPDPDTYPLHYDCFETCGALGYYRFTSGPEISFNRPDAFKLMRSLKENAVYWKFNLNTITNFLDASSLAGEATPATPWYNSAAFKSGWLSPVVNLLENIRTEENPATSFRWRDSNELAWSIINFIDADRIPQISDFSAVDGNMPTRSSCAVEDVPLINKVSIFNVLDEKGQRGEDCPAFIGNVHDYYAIPNDGTRSNHYGVAIELWYPFAPNLPTNSACYIGIYTNASDVLATTNRPWTSNELRDWFNWMSADSSNTVMQALFEAWGQEYVRVVGLSQLTNNPLWQAVTNRQDLWFTSAMTNHPSWPASDTNGVFSLTNTPIWQAFHPDTYTLLTTNASGSVTTNIYTDKTLTNGLIITPVEPLPMPEELGQTLQLLFDLLPTNSITDFQNFLMLRPDDDYIWEGSDLLRLFNSNPSLINPLLQSHQEPTLGSMTPGDCHPLWPTFNPDHVEGDNSTPYRNDQFEGYFWTIYPTQAICFAEVRAKTPPEFAFDGTPVLTTNYWALGETIPGRNKRNTLWIRPAVTIGTREDDCTNIVDEALLLHPDEADAVPVWGWTSTTNIYIPDPRRNAFAHDWLGFPDGLKWDDTEVHQTHTLSGISELPFIHYNRPFKSIGEIGHLYAAYEGQTNTYDTITFSTRSGAALLDTFTIASTNTPRYGLVQANTQLKPVIKTLLSDVKIGWLQTLDTGVMDQREYTTLDPELIKKTDGWADIYVDALTRTPLGMGWRSYADMLPSLSTNRLVRFEQDVWSTHPARHPLHDYTEDVLRGIVDKVSFRQNIFIVIVAAQTLSRTSTAQHPVVLADQRAMVTILRDAWSGRWTIRDWKWLTE